MDVTSGPLSVVRSFPFWCTHSPQHLRVGSSLMRSENSNSCHTTAENRPRFFFWGVWILAARICPTVRIEPSSRDPRFAVSPFLCSLKTGFCLLGPLFHLKNEKTLFSLLQVEDSGTACLSYCHGRNRSETLPSKETTIRFMRISLRCPVSLSTRLPIQGSASSVPVSLLHNLLFLPVCSPIILHS